MKTARHLLAPVLLALALAGPGSAAAQKQPDADAIAFKAQTQIDLKHAQDDLDKLQDEVKELGKKAITREDADKHTGDRLTDMNNRIADLNMYVALSGLALTLLAIIAGLIGFFSIEYRARKEAATVAKEEAPKTVEAWLATHETELRRRINDAEQAAQTARKHIAELETEIAHLQAQASAHIHAERDRVTAEADKTSEAMRLIAEQMGKPVSAATPIRLDLLAALERASAALNQKDESKYTFDDWNRRGYAAYGEGRKAEAAEAWRKAADMSDAPAEAAAQALFNAGVALEELGRSDEAITTYDLVEVRFANNTAPALREQVAKALVNKGVALGQLGRSDEAITADDLVDARYANDTAPALREQVARALVNKGVALRQFGRTDEAIAAYELVEARYANDTAPALRERVARALFNKGYALRQRGRTDETIAIYDLVDARYANDTAPALREQVAMALVNKGISLGQLGRTDEAIAAYELVDARYANDETPALRKQVAYAQTGKGFMLLCRAKAHWATLDQRHADLDLAARLFEQAEADIDDKPIVLGNRAYCAHLRGEPVEVVRPLLKRALKGGGERLYTATLGDLAIYPVPEDAAFRALLDEVWAELRGDGPPEAAPVAG